MKTLHDGSIAISPHPPDPISHLPTLPLPPILPASVTILFYWTWISFGSILRFDDGCDRYGVLRKYVSNAGRTLLANTPDISSMGRTAPSVDTDYLADHELNEIVDDVSTTFTILTFRITANDYWTSSSTNATARIKSI